MRRRSSWDDEGQASPSWQPQHSRAAATVPIGLASSMLTLALGAFLAGMFCAPTMTASVDAVARVVPERVRGEAMGWHGSFLTTGGALGGPIAGWAIDSHGFAGGFAAVAGSEPSSAWPGCSSSVDGGRSAPAACDGRPREWGRVPFAGFGGRSPDCYSGYYQPYVWCSPGVIRENHTTNGAQEGLRSPPSVLLREAGSWSWFVQGSPR